MKKKLSLRILALSLTVLLMSACASSEKTPEVQPNDSPLTWYYWAGYDDFFALAAEAYPDIKVQSIGYAGANRTGYSWILMRKDDIPDVFITSQILDTDLAKEQLIDLSGYEFANRFSTAVLDQVSIDGGIYLLPINNAMFGTFYNKTLMEEHGWKVPANFAELEALCAEIEAAGLTPGVLGTQLTGNTFSAVFNLAKTSWLTTPEGVQWERDFLAGNATAAGMWEGTMEYVQKYIDTGMFHTDPEDRDNGTILAEYLGGRQAVFCTGAFTVNVTTVGENGDELGMMPYISEDGSKNIYMYSPGSYVGLSKRLAEPGNEKRLEEAIQLIEFLFSSEGQETFITKDTPCALSTVADAPVPEDSLLYDAQQALWDGRAFPMTYAHWENVLSDMGQAYKEWFRGENGMDGAKCIARMDELQSSFLSTQDALYFCESTADFTIEETARMVAKALGSSVDADAAMIPYLTDEIREIQLTSGITGKLYQDRINVEICNAICPNVDGEYALLTMTGAQIKELAATGFEFRKDVAEDGEEKEGVFFPYVLETRGGIELEDDQTYRVAFTKNSYTEEVGETCSAQVENGFTRIILREWLTAQKTVSPDGNPWE